MGYLFTFAALLCGAVKGYCGKKTSGYVSAYKDAMFINMIRMLFCIAIGFLLLALQGDVSLLWVDLVTLGIAALSGVATSVFVVSWLVSVKRGAYMMLDVFLMLGVLVTLLCSLIFYQEAIKLTQWLGIGLLIVAVLIMCSYNNSIKEKITLSSLGLLILSGLSNGIADFSQKMFVKEIGGSAAVFNFYTYVFSSIVLFIFWRIFSRKAPAEAADGVQTLSSAAILKKIFGYVLVMAACLFANSFFKTLAATTLNAVQLYPLNQGCGLILSSVMSAVLFKEKLTVKCIAGLCVAFAALLVINLL